MCFSINGDTAALTQAIDTFRPRYHEDYFWVRAQAVTYLEEPLSYASAHAMAGPLLAALKSWGAGRRGAPSCRPVDTVAQALCDPALQNTLRDLSHSFGYLRMVDGKRSLKDGGPFVSVEDFDQCLIAALSILAEVIMIGSTNVTYPMKALLLTTGLTPAYDSQVKGGLRIAGVSGIDKTRYLLPRADCSDARKICALPFYIAHCVARSRHQLDAAIEDSRYPMLKGEYGRLFDVLLFLQRRRTPQTALVRFFATAGRRWYET